jgi:hypothetical protein
MTTATSDLSRVFARQIADKKTRTAADAGHRGRGDDAVPAGDHRRGQAVGGHPSRPDDRLQRAAGRQLGAYAGQVACASLQQAVSRLGMQLITEIAMAVSVRGRMFGNPKCAELLAACGSTRC